MREIPLDVVFSFPLPNYTNPKTRGEALIIVNAILISLVVVAVVLRFYTRIFIKKWLGSDDYFIGLSLIATIGLTATVILANERYGWNRHIWDLPPSLYAPAGKIAFTAKIMFTAGATFTRMSLLCFYQRLNRNSGVRWFRWIIYASMLFVVAVGVVFIALTIWQCDPIKAYWEFPPKQSSHCMDEGAVTLGAGIVNCFADLLVTLLPIPLIMKLQMPLRQRVGVIVLLCLGVIVTIAGIVRTYFIWKSLVATYDKTWYSYPLWIAAAVEIDLGVICACAPALRPLLVRHVIPHASRFTQGVSEKFVDFIPESIRASFSRASSRRGSPRTSPNVSQATQKSVPKYAKNSATQPMELELTGRAQSTEPLVPFARMGTRGEGNKGNVSVNADEVSSEDNRPRVSGRGALGTMEEEGEYPGLISSSQTSPRTTLSTPISMDNVYRQYQSVDGMSDDGVRYASYSRNYERETPRGVDVIEYRDQLLRSWNAPTGPQTVDPRLSGTVTDLEAQK